MSLLIEMTIDFPKSTFKQKDDSSIFIRVSDSMHVLLPVKLIRTTLSSNMEASTWLYALPCLSISYHDDWQCILMHWRLTLVSCHAQCLLFFTWLYAIL